jgi:hypothetical protein
LKEIVRELIKVRIMIRTFSKVGYGSGSGQKSFGSATLLKRDEPRQVIGDFVFVLTGILVVCFQACLRRELLSLPVSAAESYNFLLHPMPEPHESFAVSQH